MAGRLKKRGLDRDTVATQRALAELDSGLRSVTSTVDGLPPEGITVEVVTVTLTALTAVPVPAGATSALFSSGLINTVVRWDISNDSELLVVHTADAAVKTYTFLVL